MTGLHNFSLYDRTPQLQPVWQDYTTSACMTGLHNFSLYDRTTQHQPVWQDYTTSACMTGRVPPETKYFAETKFRRNEMAKRNGEIEIYFGEISPKRNDKIFISPKFRQNC
jgi:hypothetical protein